MLQNWEILIFKFHGSFRSVPEERPGVRWGFHGGFRDVSVEFQGLSEDFKGIPDIFFMEFRHFRDSGDTRYISLGTPLKPLETPAVPRAPMEHSMKPPGTPLRPLTLIFVVSM